MDNNSLLLSIHPQYTKLIFAGIKTVELRKIRPKQQEIDWIFVYATAPVQAIIGVCRVERVLEASTNYLWKIVREDAGITRQQFMNYYNSRERGVGIFLQQVRKYRIPVDLIQIRKVWPGFQPPQSHIYLTKEQHKHIEALGTKSL